MSYLKLDIYTISFELFITTHQLTFKLPKHELYELGSQIRRSADSVNSNIVEGYGRRIYKADYIRFLIISHGSCDETANHLRKVVRLYPEISVEFQEILKKYLLLGGKIYNYIEYVKNNWRT
ncbi:four helix bundle protein [Epilithonimonas sp.]|uniref:four helix bundle protein n=1 Tax=Epilithonimonas sp. TaxID=2894511 RepID=UPI0035B37875